MNAPSHLLRRTFQTGIALKGLDGALEAAAGVLLAVDPELLSRFGLRLWATEIVRPGRLSAYLAHASERLTYISPKFAAMYLLLHVLVIALWMNKLWAYPLAILVFAAFVVYQSFRFTHTHSLGLVLLTIFDVAI